MTATCDFDVVVVGAGPVGLVAALLLAKQGISVLLLEKERSIFPLPRAAHIDVASFRESESWYKSHFGFLTSDEIELEPGVSIGAFMRLNIGNTATDHHSLFLLEAPGDASFNHAAFEVSDVDDLMVGHDHLRQNGREHSWGVGRHILGSQVFDYWKDPNGFMLEHFTDGDLFNESFGSHKRSPADLLGTHWGPEGMPGQ